MIVQEYKDIVTPELLEGVTERNDHPGFKEDYHVLACLLRKHREHIKSVFEIGTNIGTGINIISSAVPEAKIFSLDLDYESMMKDKSRYPIGPNGEDRVGSDTVVEYTQLRGDSFYFEYNAYRCDAYFVDGEHDYDHPKAETEAILYCQPKIIIFHDADINEVFCGITDALNKFNLESLDFDWGYKLFRVEDTRIAYLLRLDLCLQL